MRRRWLWILGFLVGLGTLPAVAQETILGRFGGQPGGKNSGSGAIILKGWALADSGVRLVVIQVDGNDVGAAVYGSPRPGVLDLHPGFPDSAAGGYTYRLNTTRYLNGLHTVSAKVVTHDGNVRRLSPGRDMEFLNNTAILTPFGHISKPQPNTEVFGTCDPDAPLRRLTAIEGWVLDLGMELNDGGVGYVELMIDNAGPFLNTREDCRFIAGAGGFTDCYGLFTPGIERLYPFARDAPNAGFRFVIDVGALIEFGFAQGHHTFGIRSGDISQQVADVDEWAVFFRCIEDVNEGSFGRIESPRTGRVYSGNLTVQGWAIDWDQVNVVRILIDGQFVGRADYGEEDGIFESRPGVFSQFLNFPNVNAPVWRLPGGFDTTDLSDGIHQMQVVVIDKEGDKTSIGERTFRVNNMFP